MHESTNRFAPATITAAEIVSTRRAVLAAGAAAAAGFGLVELGVSAQDTATQSSANAVDACILTSELTEGPYFLDGDLIRQDITDGRPGAPLRLRILVTDATTCQPLPNAAVDIWHCDAHGYYSGIEGNDPGPDADPTVVAEAADQRFLRGIQLTDAHGVAEFQTIYPGWYMGRTIHIHMKVLEDGAAGQTYDGGTAVHTGQLFFDEALTEQVLQLEPYAGRPDDQRTTNDQDGILGDHADEPGFMLDLTPVSDDWLADGFIGAITIGVDPNAVSTQDGVGGAPGQDGPGGPPPEAPPA